LVLGSDDHTRTPQYKQLSTINDINPVVNNYLNPFQQYKQSTMMNSPSYNNYDLEKRKNFSKSYEVGYGFNSGCVDQERFKQLKESPIIVKPII
jgi:hypothetical protein